MPATAKTIKYWGQPATIKGRIWETHIKQSRIRPNEKVKVGLNKKFLRAALDASAILKVHVWDKDIWFQIPAWKWHAYSLCYNDFDYIDSKFVGSPPLKIYLFPIPERAYKRKNG